MSKSRVEALRDLVSLSAPLNETRELLKQYPWDSSAGLVCLEAGDVLLILDRYLRRDLAEQDVEQWANALEMRDYIDCQDDLVKDVLFELANPSITEPLTQKRAIQLMADLRRPRPT